MHVVILLIVIVRGGLLSALLGDLHRLNHCRVTSTILVSLPFGSNYRPVLISVLIVRWVS